MTDAAGDATTTLFLSATRNGRHPIGTLTSTADTFINDGTTTEYMTRHVGTYIDDKYAKIESTATREYYRVVRPTAIPFDDVSDDDDGDDGDDVAPTGLVSSSTSYEVNGRQTTEHTVHHYRTYIDGHYAHLVSSLSKVYSDPPVLSATPVFGGNGGSSVDTSPHRKKPGYYRFPKEQIRPSRPSEEGGGGGIPTRVIGSSKKYHGSSRPLKLEHLLERESKKDYGQDGGSENAIRARSVDVGDAVDPSPVEQEEGEAKKAIPTFTVAEDGKLNLPPPPSIELENEIEPTSAAFESRVKPTRTSLDSVTYIGFVDFTTTIDDTVVVFRPKKTFRTQTRNVLIPKIVPTRSRDLPLTQPSAGGAFDPRLQIQPSEPTERHRTSEPEEEEVGAPSKEVPVPKITSGINPLKSLLAASASRRNLFPKSTFSPNNRPRITLKPAINPSAVNRPPFFGRQPSSSTPPSPGRTPPSSKGNKGRAPELGELSGTLDPDSDVELVYKTLYTTYTYFTTFFRASTTRIKSREEVISNIVTLTNILSPSDLASLKSSCQFDETCSFASTSSTSLPSPSRGFIGRPNSRLVEERPRTSGGLRTHKDEVEENEKEVDEVSLGEDVNAILRTFYTTYTYFTTLFVDGTSSISTRTEIYSNVKSSGVPISILSPESVSILPISPSAVAVEIEPTASSSPSARRLEYSSIDRDVPLQSDLTTPETTTQAEEEEEKTTTADRFIVIGVTADAEVTESTPEIQPTTAIALDDEEEFPPFTTTEETPELEDVTEEILTVVEGANEEAVKPSAPTSPVKTFYTTFTYFTTLYRNGTSYITSNLETVTNTGNAEVAPTVVQPSVTFFTTFTYWTTSIDGDETIVTSSEETRTDILPASVTEGLSIEPAKTEEAGAGAGGIRFTERPEILSVSPSSTLGVLVQPTATPEIESGAISPSSVQVAADTPSLDASQSSVDSFENLDNEFTLVSASPASVETKKKSSSKVPRPSRTRTPVIRPNLFRSRNQSSRPRPGRTRTTVAIITRSDATPTLIATPASSLLQPTPSFEQEGSSRLVSASLVNRGNSRFSSSRGVVVSSSGGISPSSVNPSAISPSSTRNADPFKPSIISNLRLRRPNPFRARLRERQRVQLQRLRNNNSRPKEQEVRVEAADQNEEATTQRATVPIPRFPPGLPGRTPIFISSRTENFSRRPKVVVESNGNGNNNDGPTPTASSPNSSRSTEVLRLQRERAKARIQALFKRRRPNFLRPRPSPEGDLPPHLPSEDPLVAQESRRRRKRQVSSSTYYSEFGARTRKRQTYLDRRRHLSSSSSSSSSSSNHRQPEYFDTLETPPFTAFGYNDASSSSSSSYPSTYAQQSPNANAYESYYDDYNSRHHSSSPAASTSGSGGSSSSSNSNSISSKSSGRTRSSNNVRRQVRQDDVEAVTRSRSRSRFNPNRGRTRLTRTRPTAPVEEKTTTPRPSFSRSRFRPRTLSTSSRGQNRFQSETSSTRFSNSNRFGGSSFRRTTPPPRTSLFDYDDYYDYDTDVEIQSSQNTVPESITVTHHVPIMTVIPVRENGRDELRDILTPSPSLEVIAATALKSTDVDGKPVIFANTEVNEIAPGTKDVTYEALRATETTTIIFTPTRIRGFRTRFSHIVPSTIYNIQPVTTRVVEPVDQNQLLSQLLLTLLGPGGGGSLKPGALAGLSAAAGQPGGLPAAAAVAPAPQPPPTQFVTHTNTYVTTITNTESTVLPITLRGREIKTTLVESITEVVTATEFSTETIINAVAPTALPNFGFQPQPQQPQPNPLQTFLPDLQQQLLAAQLQQQLRAQQQQLLNQQLLSQVNLDPAGVQRDPIVQTAPPQHQQPAPPPLPVKPDPPAPSTSIVTKFVSGKSPGEFHVVTSTVTLFPGEEDGNSRRRKREALLLQQSVRPSPVEEPETTRPPPDPTSFLLLDPSVDDRDVVELSLNDLTDDSDHYIESVFELESSLGSGLFQAGPSSSSSSSSWQATPTSAALDELTTLLLG